MQPDSHVFGALVVERRRTVIGRDTLVIAGLALLVSFFGVNCTRLLDRVRHGLHGSRLGKTVTVLPS